MRPQSLKGPLLVAAGAAGAGAGHMLPYEEPDRLAEIILSAPTTQGGAT